MKINDWKVIRFEPAFLILHALFNRYTFIRFAQLELIFR